DECLLAVLSEQPRLDLQGTAVLAQVERDARVAADHRDRCSQCGLGDLAQESAKRGGRVVVEEEPALVAALALARHVAVEAEDQLAQAEAGVGDREVDRGLELGMPPAPLHDRNALERNAFRILQSVVRRAQEWIRAAETLGGTRAELARIRRRRL